MEEIRRLASQLYEEGNQSKCYAAIWRTRIYPLYGVCYHTFLSYIHTPQENPASDDDPLQLKLFNDDNDKKTE